MKILGQEAARLATLESECSIVGQAIAPAMISRFLSKVSASKVFALSLLAVGCSSFLAPGSGVAVLVNATSQAVVSGGQSDESGLVGSSLMGSGKSALSEVDAEIIRLQRAWVPEVVLQQLLLEESQRLSQPAFKPTHTPSAALATNPSFSEQDSLGYQLTREYVTFASWLRSNTQQTEFNAISAGTGVNTRQLAAIKDRVGGIDQSQTKVSVISASEQLVKEAPYAFKDATPQGKLPGNSTYFESTLNAKVDQGNPIEMGVVGIALWIVGLVVVQQAVRYLMTNRESS
jgi:hypothetical protein